MRVGVIGTGFGKRVVAPAFAATAGCEVVDVVSARDEAAVRALTQRADIDLISVHSPPFLHAAHVRAALAANRAVLCDKPFAMNAAEAAALEAEAAAAGVIALCNFEFRYAPLRQHLRDVVASGTLGAIEHVQWTHTSSGSRVPLRPFGWLFDRSLGGGWIGAWASHAVDTLRWMLGEITDVTSRPRLDIRERPDADGVLHECTAEDGLTAALTLESGATVAIDSTFAAVATLPPSLSVFGSKGAAVLVADRQLAFHGIGAETYEADATREHHEQSMRKFTRVVCDAVDHHEIPPGTPTFSDGRACDAVLDRLRSAKV